MSRSAEEPARPDRWKTTPLPALRELLPYYRALNAEEMRRIAKGFVPSDMDQKWFVCLDGDVLHFYRSWTGYCIYEVRLERDPVTGGAVVREAYANRDPSEYAGTDARHDARFLDFMIEVNFIDDRTPYMRSFSHETPGWQWAIRSADEQDYDVEQDVELMDIALMADRLIPAFAVNDWTVAPRTKRRLSM